MPALQADDDPYVPVPTVTQTVVWRTRPGSLVGGVTAGVVLWFIFTFMIFWNLGRMAWCFARKEDRHPAVVHNIIPPECAFTNATHVRHVYLSDTLSVPHVRDSGHGDFPERTGFTPVSGLSSRRSSSASGSGRKSPRAGGPSPGTSRERMVHFADEVDVMPDAEERRGSQPPEYAPEPSPDCQRCAAGVMPGGYDVSAEHGEGVQRSESGARVEVWPGGGEGGGVQLGNGMTKVESGAGVAGVGQTNGEAGGDVGQVVGASLVAGPQVAGAVQRVAPSGDERRVDAETVDESPQGILGST